MLMLGVPALFSDANILDALLMIAAACLAVLHGAVLPAAMFVFGLLTNAFVNQYSSAQLANYELEFDPLEYIEMGRLAAVDVRVILSGFINFTNITGGVVNCSDSYELLPFNQTFDDILQLGVTRLARCLDNPTFLALVNIYTVIFLGLGVASWLLGGAHVTLFRLSGVRQVRRLRNRLFSSLLRQEMGWFDATPPGEVVSRISEDVGKVEEGLGEKLGLLLQWMATLVAGVIVSVLTEWRLTLLMAFAGLLIAGSTAVLSVVTSITTSRSLSLSAAASAIAEEALAAIATVKAFCAEDEETKRYSQALQGVRWYGSIVGVVRGGSLGVVQLLVFGCYASSFWLGAYLVQEELIQAGEFVTVFFAVLLVGVSVGQTLPHLQRLIAANTADRRLQDLATRVPLVAHYEEEVWPEGGLQPSIQFQNVTFSYPTRPQLPVLKDVNFSIAPGEIVAIVGATGSGKSTIGHLLTRLYDITKGEITVGGVDVRQLPMERLREQVGVVSQDPALFQSSIAENIGLGSGGVASQEAIELAARQAYAHEFITQLPQGYSTVVGSRGSQLSGGQRQRLAIARALVRNPKILLLDEATSALDTESERMVQEALDKAREGRTTVIIAHRLSTVRHANTIIVMEKGGVAEMGSHEELLKKEGVYYNLVHAQLTEEVAEGESAPSQSPLTPLSPLLSPGFATQLSQIMEEEKTSTSASWFSVLRLSMNELPLLVVGVIAAGVQGAVFPSFSIFFGRALEAFTFPFNQVFGLIHKWAGLFLALGFVSAVSTVIKNVAFSLAGEELVYRLRCRGLSQTLRHHLSWFDQPASTGVAGVLASSPPLVPGVMLALSSLTEVSVGLAAALIISFVSSWILALVIILFIPLLLVAGLVQVQLLRSGTRTETPSTQILQESVVNMKIVQLFGLQQTFLLQYTSSLAQSLWRRCIEAIGVGVVYGFTNFILLAAYAVTFRFAAYLLTLPVDHTLYANFDEVFTVFLAIILGSLTAGQASTALPLATQAAAAASKLQTVMTTTEGEEWEGRQLEEVKGKVDVVNVSFSFPSRPAVRVLSRLSVTVAAGESLALVGPSGAGKSTVFSLLERLYSPGSGQLTVDYTDISSLGLRWWRQQLGWVPQDVVLFNRTISENISFGCEAGEEQIVAAATAANAHSFILSLPQGYSTVVGSRGSQLSGGQRQRLAIARALVRNPKILLLDEATSALDTESERMVQEALDKAREGRTTIIIAHRLSTVAKADQIAVLRAGRVVECGNHSQLLQHQGLYWRLLQTNQQPS